MSKPTLNALHRTTAWVATIGVVVALVGIGLSLRPVATPTQDCGTTLAFLVEGRSNIYVDPNDLPDGVTASKAQANNELPCRERVADQAKPALILFTAGVLSALGALIVEATSRGWAWRKRARRHHHFDAAHATGHLDGPDESQAHDQPTARSPQPTDAS